MTPDKNVLNRLRKQIAHMEGHRSEESRPALNSGTSLAFLASLFEPRLHEIVAEAYGDLPAASAFCLALLCQNQEGMRGPILWCQSWHDAGEFGRPYGPGLKGFGISVERLVFVRTRREQDLLWAAEEGIRSGALSAAVIYLARSSLTASRRLALAAQECGTPCFALRPHNGEMAGAAWTRWQVSAAPSHPQTAFLQKNKVKSLGRPAWTVTCARDRSAGLHIRGSVSRMIEWDYETHYLHLAAPMAHRPPETCSSAGDIVPFVRAG